MFYIKYFILLHFTIATPQFNLYYTDLVSKSNNASQYNCLRIVTYTRGRNIGNHEIDIINREIMSYCMNEFSPKFHVEEKTNHFQKFTFDDLSKENISSEQLYRWSAPIDLIEKYQFYLNQLSALKDLSLSKEIFYNCTLPRFGLQCQYEFYDYHSNFPSLSELVHKFYTTNVYDPTTLTCYKHLTCYHGPNSICLDWSDICNGHIDCIDSGLDEEHCWELEINQCNDNQYRCDNGHCIPKIFYQDDKSIADCIDTSDEILYGWPIPNLCNRNEPAFGCEERMCKESPFLTSSCVIKREYLLMKAIFSIKDNSASEECWFAIKCMFDRLYSEEPSCHKLRAEDSRRKMFLDTCPKMLYIPEYPLLYGDTYIAVEKNHLKEMSKNTSFDIYICYNQHSRYDASLNIRSEILFNNRTCFKGSRLGLPIYGMSNEPITKYYNFLNDAHEQLIRYRLFLNYTSTICNRSNMYQCMNSSKCISTNRFFDDDIDCTHLDDISMSVVNNNPNLKEQLNKTRFYCPSLNRYISRSMINNGYCNCKDTRVNRCIDENIWNEDTSREILFSTICDGFQELLPIVIENKTETDETECEQWECYNIYTRCDGVWNCPNGVDEIGCNELSRLQCNTNQHLCVSILTYLIDCVDINKVNDGNIDCIGGTDEPRLIIYPPHADAGNPHSLTRYGFKFTCMNQTISPAILPFMLCNGATICDHGDDEKFCVTDQTKFTHRGICLPDKRKYGSFAEKFLCDYLDIKLKNSLVYFKLSEGIINLAKKISENNIILSSLPTMKISSQNKSHCHRGLNLHVWSNNDNDLCLCPPSYYGDNCQYQNQRISLVIKFRSLSDSLQIQFAIIISLIDDSDDRIIHSYEQITYLSLINCGIKYQFYLLYSTRPKDTTKTYSIHIDVYEKKTLIHRGSLLFPILFPFLPVHRLALIVDIPPASNTKNQICSNQRCNHGQCIKYVNNISFCQCKEGWSGRYCNRKYTHTCSSDSLCIGISADNRSICVCPSNKFGPRCLLTGNTRCQMNTDTLCEHGGQCIPNNPEDIIFTKEFTCACSPGYSGKRCEIVDNVFSLSFNKDIVVSQQIIIHFIRIMNDATHERSTTFRSIPIREDLINITWSQEFHIAFIDLSNKTYYLIVNQSIYIPSRNISKMINPSDRCPHITELFNESFVQWHIRRIKYYHLPCQNQSLNLPCFYDDFQFCLCYHFGRKRLANCFNFDHNMKFDCQGQSECENNAQCFQDQPECAKKSICVCASCYFGPRCQLTTNGLGLSLDVILGYQILPYIGINHQPFIIKLSLGLTIIFIIIGVLNGILSLMTFKDKTVCTVGCGLYLLTSSITTLFIMIMFGLKFFILLLSHMSIISNESFLTIQCYSFDFILRIFLSINQWLHACVAIERTITVIKGARFDKKKSKKTAKLVITILFIIVAGSFYS